MTQLVEKVCTSNMKFILKIAFRIILSGLPASYSAASHKQKFSLLKFVKNILRLKITNERLNSLKLIKCESNSTNNINLQEIVTSWAKLKKLKDRRIKIKF